MYYSKLLKDKFVESKTIYYKTIQGNSKQEFTLSQTLKFY